MNPTPIPTPAQLADDSDSRPARVEVYPDAEGGWRWRLKARNGEIVAASESYTTPSSARRSISRLKAIAPHAELRMVVTPGGES